MSAPVHVLMLPSSSPRSSSGNIAAQKELDRFMKENEGDYLDRRNKVSRGQKRGADHDGAGRATNEPVTLEALWSGSSPLEVAIAMFCDHEGEDPVIDPKGGHDLGESDGATIYVSGSSDIEETDGAASGGGRSKSRSSPGSSYRCGSIGKGNEGKFAALIARHCHTAGDRALALAVLQRTMERDELISEQPRGKKRKRCESDSSPPRPMPCYGAEEGKSEEPSGHVDDAKPTAKESTNAEKGECEMDCHRMAKFLSAGGLKVLNQWLIDAFTPVPAATSGAQSKEKGKRLKTSKDQDGTSGTMTSPTGPILLPLLSILQSIPFKLELVMDSQINKQIKKLKKNLDRLVSSFDEEESESESESDSETSGSDENAGESKTTKQRRRLEMLTHPVSGGMPIVQVQKDVEKLMQTWKDAASDKSDKGGQAGAGDFYDELRATMEERFLALSQYESGEAKKPTWLEELDLLRKDLKSPPPLGGNSAAAQKAAATAKDRHEEQLEKQSEASRRLQQQQAELKAAQAARLEAREKMEQYRKRMMQRDGNMLKKRKDAPVVESQVDVPAEKKSSSSRRVTWADQKTAGAKLAEVREFVRETDVYQSDDDEKRGQDNDDESDEKLEEDDFDDGDYDDETQASDSIDSDEFDAILNDDVNFPQEEPNKEKGRENTRLGVDLERKGDVQKDTWESLT